MITGNKTQMVKVEVLAEFMRDPDASNKPYKPGVRYPPPQMAKVAVGDIIEVSEHRARKWHRLGRAKIVNPKALGLPKAAEKEES